MKEKIRYVFKENWSVKIFGVEIKNKNIKFDIPGVLFSICIFCYFFQGIVSFIDINMAIEAHDIMSVINSIRINYESLFFACIFGVSSNLIYYEIF